MVKHLVRPGVTLSRSTRADFNLLSALIGPWDFKEQIDVGIVGVPYNISSYNFQGSNQAPDAIRETFLSFATRSFDFDQDIGDLKVRDIGDIQMYPFNVPRCQANIEEGLTDLYRTSPRFVPIVIGGNHAIAAPSIRGFRNGHDFKKAGLIDFDAHNDLGDPAAEGPTAGTMFKQVIDAGQIEGRNAVQIGLHGSLASPVQKRYAASVGLREISAREVRRTGIEKIMEEALAQAGDDTDAIYVSFDIDAVEEAMAPGTGVPAPGGLDVREAFEAVYMLGRHPKVKALDLVEVDPIKDVKGMTSRVACMILVSFLAGLKQRLQDYA